MKLDTLEAVWGNLWKASVPQPNTHLWIWSYQKSKGTQMMVLVSSSLGYLSIQETSQHCWRCFNNELRWPRRLAHSSNYAMPESHSWRAYTTGMVLLVRKKMPYGYIIWFFNASDLRSPFADTKKLKTFCWSDSLCLYISSLVFVMNYRPKLSASVRIFNSKNRNWKTKLAGWAQRWSRDDRGQKSLPLEEFSRIYPVWTKERKQTEKKNELSLRDQWDS